MQKDMQVLPNVKFTDPHYSFGLIKADEDDKHFRELATIPFPRVEVIGIDDFMKYLDRSKHK